MSSFLTFGDFADDDPDRLTADAVAFLQSVVPGWVPADGNLDTWMLAAHARINAELLSTARDVPAAIFQAYGQRLIGVPPVTGAAATVTVTWAATDSLGHTVPAGTQVGYRVSGDTLLVFVPLTDVVIPPGSTNLGGSVLTAVGVGTAWNGVPTGVLELVDSLSWLSSVTATAVSSGGVDAETDDQYVARLTVDLRLLAPRPILPADFSVFAQTITGVTRAYTIDGYDPGVNEVQRLTVTGTPAGGSSAVTFSGQTATVPFNTTAGALQTLLEALSNIAPGDVACTGGPWPGTAIDVQFMGAYASTNVPTMTKVDSFTGGSSPTLTVTTPTSGVAPSSGNQRMVTVVSLDAAGAGVSSGVKAAVQADLDGRREVGFVVHTADPTSTTIDVVYSVHVLAGFDSTAVVAACTAAVTAYLTPANWDGGTDSPPTWSGADKVRYNQVVAVLSAITGVAYVASLTVNAGTVDVTLSGVAPLPAVGTISGSAV